MEHAKQDYHLMFMVKMTEFITRYQKPSIAINMQIQVAAQKRIEDNQKVTESLLKVILLCGKQLRSCSAWTSGLSY